MILSGCSLGKKITMEDKAKIDFQGHRGCEHFRMRHSHL